MTLNTRYEDVAWIDHDDSAHIGEILHVILQMLLFGLGLILQVKIILVARDEKDTTWQIHICHSVVLTIYYFFTIIFRALMHFVPFISSFTGSWLCYVAFFMQLYGYYAIINHTLLVAIMKFAFIVQREKVTEFGKEQTKKVFLWINLCFPLFWTALGMLSSENTAFPPINVCFQRQKQLLMPTNTTSQGTIFFFFCEFGHEANVGQYAYMIYIIKRGCCIFLEIAHLGISSNLPEVFFYQKIFRKMQT